jgi:hypothetical protein
MGVHCRCCADPGDDAAVGESSALWGSGSVVIPVVVEEKNRGPGGTIGRPTHIEMNLFRNSGVQRSEPVSAS